MQKILKQLIFSFMIVIVFTCFSHGKNRFNVFTYSDYANISNLDSFYIQLSDSFMVSMLYTFNADSSGYYKNLHNLDLELFTNHWRSFENQWVNIGANLNIVEAAKALHARMGCANDDAIQGYDINSTDHVGGIFNDDIDGRSVLRARENIDTAGVMHPKFSKGLFHQLNPLLAGDEFTYEASMRLPDTVGNPETVVATMIFEEAGIASCSTSTSKYAVNRHNDTLLVAYDGSNYIAYPTIDRTPISNSTYTCVDYCGGSVFENKSTMSNICYIDSIGDTICSIPYKYTKDIYDSDFSTEASYESIFMQCYGDWGNWSRFYKYKVHWSGERTLYLDSLYVFTEDGYIFDSLITNDGGAIADSIENWYKSHTNAKSQIDGVYFIDEPKGVEFQSIEKVNTILDSIDNSGNNYPTRQFSTLGEYQNPVIDGYGGQYYDSYIEYSQDDYFVFDYYVCFAYLTSSSEDTGFTNIQCMFNRMEGAFEEARTRISAINTQQGKNIDFWVTLQAFDSYGEFVDNGVKKHVKTLRKYTPNESKAAINMSLLYGAKGIGYWEYVSKVNCNKTTTLQSDSINFKNFDDLLQATTDYNCAGSPRSITDYCPIPADSCAVGARPYSNTGLVCRDEGKPQELWNDFRIMNVYMDSMAYFFNNATWKSAGNETDNLYSLNASFIDSVKTLANYDDAFIQVGFFEDSNSTKFAYILNKRVDDGTYDWVDSQNVRIYINDDPGLYAIWDVYANSSDTLYDSAGFIMPSIYLDPGEAKLIKYELIENYTWSGTIDKDWMWATLDTIQVVGDLTIDSGVTLNILSKKMNLSAFSDATSSGSDTTKTEIIIDGGTLRIEGSSSNRIELDVDTTASVDSAWYGIRTKNGGKVFIDNAKILNAYAGVKLIDESADTVINTRFENCYLYGIYNESNNAYFQNDTFITTLSGYGIKMNNTGSNVKIQSSYFEDIKYAIDLYSSSPEIQSCKFYTNENSITNQSAIYTDWYSDAIIENCEFNNVDQGIVINLHSDLEVSNCLFDSDSIPAYYSTKSPFMYRGINAVKGGSSIKIRNSCFKNIEGTQVFRNLSSVDIGTASDSGLNNFYYYTDTAQDGSPESWPSKHIYNSAVFGTLNAQGNYIEDTTLIYQYSTVDFSNLNSVPFTLSACNGSSGGQSKVITFYDVLPQDYSITQNYPNPFNPETQFEFTLPKNTKVKIEIFNILGRKVKTLMNEGKEAGTHIIQWDGSDGNGNHVASGVYFYRFETLDFIETKKMLMLK